MTEGESEQNVNPGRGLMLELKLLELTSKRWRHLLREKILGNRSEKIGGGFSFYYFKFILLTSIL